MIRNVYCIYDSGAKESALPFLMKNDDVAIRSFTDTVNRELVNVKTVKLSNYQLHYVGTYDTETMTLSPAPSRMIIAGDQVEIFANEDVPLTKETIEKVVALTVQQFTKSKKHWWSK